MRQPPSGWLSAIESAPAAFAVEVRKGLKNSNEVPSGRSFLASCCSELTIATYTGSSQNFLPPGLEILKGVSPLLPSRNSPSEDSRPIATTHITLEMRSSSDL